MTSQPIIIWFRQDLRLSDHPALYKAVQQGNPILPVYILDDEHAGNWKMGAASRVWLHHALKELNQQLDGNLLVLKGKADEVIPDLVKKANASGVYWTRCYEPWRIKRDKRIKEALSENDIDVKSFKGSLIWEPWEIQNQSGEPYKVFTPFYRKGCLPYGEPSEPLSEPENLSYAEAPVSSQELNLLPERDWHDDLIASWDIGENGAQKRLREFLEEGLSGYKEKRNNPALPNVSRLSPYLHWGHISPRQVWHQAKDYAASHKVSEKDIDHFCSELGWREFSHHLLYHFPTLPEENYQNKFDDFPWRDAEPELLERWQFGKTGYPIVDAGMRELYQTGYMHNRVRMIVASFLIKNMMCHWRVGEEWFWDTLFDADLANNSASWQWVAGSGADAAPYFRIFNPVTQGEKFDTEGTYIRTYVPEIADLPDKLIHKPWDASSSDLQAANIELGETYPEPMMEHKFARERALEAFEGLKKA